MSKLIWGASGSRLYQAGLDRVVFYPVVGSGVAWDGVIALEDKSVGSKETRIYIDGQGYHSRASLGEFAATLETFTYPEEFEPYDGVTHIVTGQPKKPFHLSYRTLIGNDTRGSNFGYRLHLVYNILASPSPVSYSTTGRESSVSNFVWDLTTSPSMFQGVNSSSHLIVDTTKAYPAAVEAIEQALYGSENTPPRIPSILEVFDLFEDNALIRITDHGDGTFTASGPDEAVRMIGPTEFQLSWDAVELLNDEMFRASSQ